jgi:hypothetical protein
LITALAASVAVLGARASADTAPIDNSPDLPWSNPGHTSNLEVLAGQIATHIAGRDASVRCEGDTDWTDLAQQRRFDPAYELGYVSIVNSPTGPSLTDFAELSGTMVCLPLKQFAASTVKPTKCLPSAGVSAAKKNSKRPVRKVAAAAAPAACYLGRGKRLSRMTPGFWSAYEDYAQAIETLAHEAVHMSGVFSESVAECSGMQRMQWAGEQLGDTPDDAEAIAKYFWEDIYTLKRVLAPAYWSADCRPGGALDIRPPGKTDWP